MKKMPSRKEQKHKNAAQVTQTVGDFVKENINMFLHMGLKPLVINMAGFWDIPFSLEINMIAGHSRHFMTSYYHIIRK